MTSVGGVIIKTYIFFLLFFLFSVSAVPLAVGQTFRVNNCIDGGHHENFASCAYPIPSARDLGIIVQAVKYCKLR